ncbi:hypothetical protein BTR14_10985 [Rhizobium rhizosphaerae]|uniref:Uncharacterized protein n=1 Tax=Xaviernesmea rhizosphaerae TaxID=1672749 RepID=A0ABX3PCP3_9HYPH|nr:hypothetical protein [Xaviernesmea rhizosphaerae]OQP86225.1 hypothetical protein BTR14_10985 [Xaviernesmea rhizosphaerae]
MARFVLQQPLSLHQPFSGDVTQTINPWTWVFSPQNVQIGLFNIDLGPSGDPQVEAEVLRDVASYGRQIGRCQDVLAMLLDRLEAVETLQGADRDAAEDFRSLLREIGKVKKRKGKR